MSKERATEFIRTYNEVSGHLVKITGMEGYTSFSKLVDKATATDSTVRKFHCELKDFGRLRNAIVHHAGFPQEIIAEPREDAVRKFQALVATVMSPKLVIPTFEKSVRVFRADEQLSAAVAYMRSNDFSQVVVRDGPSLRLLAAEGVAGWVASRLDDGPSSVNGASLVEALEFGIADNFELVSPLCTIYEIRERFTTCIDRGKPRLDAILVTNSGTRSEPPIGIVTPWDLLTVEP